MDINFSLDEIMIVPFETLYFDKDSIKFIRDHFLRFKRSFWILGRKFDLDFEQFEAELYKFIANSLKEYGGLRTFYINNRLYVEDKEIRYNRDLFKKGFELRVAKARKDKHNILNYIKTNNIAVNLIEEKWARKNGFDSCLFLNQEGFVCEVAFANIFFRKDKTIYTPHIFCGILPGIVRKHVIRVSENMGFKVEKGYFTFDDIKKMDECFITSSIAGVFPVLRIEEVEFQSRAFLEELLSCKDFTRPWIA